MDVPSYILSYIITRRPDDSWFTAISIKKLIHDQQVVTLYNAEDIHMAFIKHSSDYYLAVIQDTSMYHESILTLITPNQRCLRIDELFNLTLLRLPRIRRIKYYHLPCQTRLDLWCFFDEIYMCVCTSDNHTNCIKFDHEVSFACKHNDFCDNGASCFQDDITCPSSTICICTDCYFGTRCQFYAKGFGLTLDDILRYELRRNFSLSQQRVSIKTSAIVTMFMSVLGLINGILSYLTFRRERSQQVGCGIQILVSDSIAN
ncbi:unnamed protein product [Adineta steineri]|uniref:EGF-like domain-containing protein n=1 Tax=Adineta steineri TaxID=433720 RepID=A0A815NI82_9BILA|nr:unnamed protein product [Adineta steineri]CAF1624813.1 unnamed protein product [Adineta steineri]